MDLTKKSASGREKKFKRMFILFLKEINGMKYWRTYVNSQEYMDFNNEYARRHNLTNCEYWNRDYCIDILGCCNFSSYVGKYYLNLPYPKRLYFEHSYKLFAVFLFIFWREEYRRYYSHLEEYNVPPIYIDFKQPIDKQYESLLNRFDSVSLKTLIKRWITLKQCCNED